MMWALGALWSMVVFLVGGFLGDLKGSWSVRHVAAALTEHTKLDGHPVSLRRHEDTERRMEHIERLLVRIDDRVAGKKGASA